jgi:anti-sigma factor RsiW
MAEKGKISDAYLHAFIDGQLSKKQYAEFEDYLVDNPTKIDQVDQYIQVATKIHDIYDPVLDEPVPDSILKLFELPNDNLFDEDNHVLSGKLIRAKQGILTKLQSLGTKIFSNVPNIRLPALTSPFKKPASFALPVAWTMACVLLGWVLHFGTSSTLPNINMTAEQHAINAHIIYAKEKKHMVEVAASETKHLMKWLSKRLNASVGPANLKDFNFELVGGRLLPVNQKHAGLYMYKNQDEVRLSLYISSVVDNQQTADIQCDALEKVQICSWKNDALAYFVISEIPAADLKQIAMEVRYQLPQIEP